MNEEAMQIACKRGYLVIFDTESSVYTLYRRDLDKPIFSHESMEYIENSIIEAHGVLCSLGL